MEKQNRQTEIMEHSYTTELFGGSRALRLGLFVSKRVSAPVAAILETPIGGLLATFAKGGKIGDIMESSVDANMLKGTFTSAVHEFLDGLTESELHRFVTGGKTLDETPQGCVGGILETTKRDGKPINFELDFTGGFLEIMQVVGWVVKENFSPFGQTSNLGKKLATILDGFGISWNQTETTEPDAKEAKTA